MGQTVTIPLEIKRFCSKRALIGSAQAQPWVIQNGFPAEGEQFSRGRNE